MQINEQKTTCGILLVDKPTGMTSHAVVAKLRRFLGIKKIGHTGTLDPMATGLLILLIGKKATIIAQSFIELTKNYEGRIRLGVTTDSFDVDGKITSTNDIPKLKISDLQTLATTFLGKQMQIPPMFSAKKVNGQCLYKLARQGKEIERKGSEITIFEFAIIDFNEQSFKFKIKCSKGTFVRTIAHDFGQKLGCGAHLTELCRTKIGNFDIKNASQLNKILNSNVGDIEQNLITPHDALQMIKS